MGAEAHTRFPLSNCVNNFYEKANCKPENISRRPQTPRWCYAHQTRAKGLALWNPQPSPTHPNARPRRMPRGAAQKMLDANPPLMY